jgi:N-acetylmuramoyl-L-alanine amidase
MPWNKLRLAACAVAGVCWALAISSAAPDQQVTVYTAQTTYSLPVMDRGSGAYIALADLLTPLGATQPAAKAKEWRVQLNKAEVRLTEGKENAVVRDAKVDLGGKVLVEGGKLLVPLAAASPLLTRLLNVSIDFHQPSRRIFVGNAFARFTALLTPGGATALTLNFSQPVHPEIGYDEEQGRTILIFKKEPLISEVNKQQFAGGAIASLTFTEENGAASLTIRGNAKLNIVRSDDGRTITLEPVVAVAAPSPAVEQTAPATADNQKRAQEFFVMIDPSHGGYDRGVNFGGKVIEKDITLKLARELHRELEERGIPSRMLRDSDVDVPLDRRAEIANEQKAGMYIALHAGRPGHGVRVYSALLADPQPAAGRFLVWDSAQGPALDRSKLASHAVAGELRKKGIAVTTLGIPIRPLNNVVAPAIAVEVAPEGDDLQSLESPRRNTGIATAIAAAIAQVRWQMGARP